MDRSKLTLIKNIEVSAPAIPFSQMLDDHNAILQGYLDTHITRNHSDKTIEGDRRFLRGWFEGFMVADDNHPDGERQLFLWETMEPVLGRKRIIKFSKGLIETGLKARTVHGYLGSLRRLFEYVLEYPYVPGAVVEPIVSKYARIEQPVVEYDYPAHVLDQEDEGFVLTGEQLLNFYDFVRMGYIEQNQKKFPASRDYVMTVIAGESGLRADEIRYLDALGPHRDLYYEQNRIQTRYGKAANGSGKRVRKTIFTRFAQDTVKVYEEQIRPAFPNAKTNTALFLSEGGSRITYKSMWRNLHVIADEARKAKLEMPEKFSWHSLRKSFATNFIEAHPDRVWLLMDLMGHMSPGTIHRYVKHSRSYYEQALNDVIEELVPEPTRLKGAM
jgi:site-specific recombinase XerD